MPGVRDKIVINGLDFDADAQAMKAAFNSALALAIEAEKLPTIGAKNAQQKAHQAFTAKQEAICEGLDKAMSKAIKSQRELNNELRKWIDEELELNKP